jgi:hypothetical protein
MTSPQIPLTTFPNGPLDCQTGKHQINNAATQLQTKTITVQPVKNFFDIIYPAPYIGNGIITRKIRHKTADIDFAINDALANSLGSQSNPKLPSSSCVKLTSPTLGSLGTI